MNKILAQSDKIGENSYPSWLVEGFNEVVIDCGLVDMNLIGHQYTWERSRGTSEWIET